MGQGRLTLEAFREMEERACFPPTVRAVGVFPQKLLEHSCNIIINYLHPSEMIATHGRPVTPELRPVSLAFKL